jgi:hypothetical protein
MLDSVKIFERQLDLSRVIELRIGGVLF